MSIRRDIRSLIDNILNGTPRQTIITFPNGEYENIESGIHTGSASIEKSLCDDEESVIIQGCIASTFKVTVEGIDDLSEIKIKVIQRIGEYELPLFTGWVDECPLQSDRKSRTITGYDAFYRYGNCNVSEWYNALNFPLDIRDFLTLLLDYVGIPYPDNLEVRQQFNVNKTLETISMDFISTIKAICQVIGGFGIINTDGEFDIVYLSNEVSEQTLSAMSGFELEPYTVKPIDKVVVRSEETDIGGYCGEGNNAYIVQGNFLCFGMTPENIQSVAAGLYNNISGFSWKPCLFELSISNPLIGCDGIRYKVTTSQGDEFETYLMNSYLSGVQLFDQELESFGTEYRNEVVADDYTNNFILAYRVMKLKATVDGFDLQIENKVGEDEVITKINASAEKITISSSKIDIAGLVKFINDDNGDETLIDGGKIKTDNLTSISANIGGFVFKDGNMCYLQESIYKSFEDGTSEGEDITTKWYSSGFSAVEYEQNSDEKAIWLGAHPIINGDGLDDKSYYTEDKLFYPFYITAGGKIVSKGEDSTTIFGSGHKYTLNMSNWSWDDSRSTVFGTEAIEIDAGSILLNELIRFSGKGFEYNNTDVLAFNTNGIYSPDINAETLSAKESISTAKLYTSEITVGSGGIYSNGKVVVLGDIETKTTLPGTTANIKCGGDVTAGLNTTAETSLLAIGAISHHHGKGTITAWSSDKLTATVTMSDYPCFDNNSPSFMNISTYATYGSASTHSFGIYNRRKGAYHSIYAVCAGPSTLIPKSWSGEALYDSKVMAMKTLTMTAGNTGVSSSMPVGTEVYVELC